MKKIDYKKELKYLYSPSPKEVVMIEVPKMNFLIIDGKGDPNTSKEYHEAIEALFSVSYTIKFSIKKGEKGIDYAVMPLESLWWVEDMSKFSAGNKSDWQWTAMIMQPEFISKDLVNESIKAVQKKKGLEALAKIRFELFEEGLSAQIMYIGPFSEEGSTINRIHDFIREKGYILRGKHHEIYLSDPRKAKPEKMKTVLRQPMGK